MNITPEFALFLMRCAGFDPSIEKAQSMRQDLLESLVKGVWRARARSLCAGVK